MDISWSNITELVIATAFGGVVVWLFTNSATPFFKKHKLRIFRFPTAPREGNDDRWCGYYIRNTSASKASSVEILFDSKLDQIEFKPKIIHEIKDVDEETTVISIISLPAKSEYTLWTKSNSLFQDIKATADGTGIENDDATYALKHWREWHRTIVFLMVVICANVTFFSVMNMIFSSTPQAEPSAMEQLDSGQEE